MKIGFLLFAGALGMLMFTRFFPKASWISRYPLAFVMGNTAGIYLMSELAWPPDTANCRYFGQSDESAEH